MKTYASVWGGAAHRRRRIFAGLVLGTAATAASVPAFIFSSNGITPLEAAALAVIAVLFLWIGVSFWTATIGFVVRGRAKGDDPTPISPAGGESVDGDLRVAVVMPIYNEDVSAVFARLAEIERSLRSSALDGNFDMFILSDTTDPDIWIREECAWRDLCRSASGWGRIFYRHRTDNKSNKSGNIADFCIRWGRHYAYMVVLDADSLMSGSTIAELTRRIDNHPEVGMIQVPPMPVNGETLFARLQQFAASAYGPIFAAGAAYWQLGEANYWGHNAIIRMKAFMRHCGLPKLPGTRPWGGEILSHDFVEAALMRRAGYEVWLAPDLAGSYEEVPGTLGAYVKRDRRWCQGNLQHLRLVAASGLHPVNRLHLFMGAFSYLASPVWLAFLLVSCAVAIEHRNQPREYFSIESLFPTWPHSHATEAGMLLVATLLFLFGPKFLGFLDLCRSPKLLAAHGGRFKAAAGVILESLFSMLLAPILMAFQVCAVAAVVAGRDAAWTPQKRRGWKIGLGRAASAYGGITIAGVAVSVAAYASVPDVFPWLIPVIVGPISIVPLSLLLGSVRCGRWFRQLGLLQVPSESTPDPILQAFRDAHRRLEFDRDLGGRSMLRRAIADPIVNATHIVLLRAAGQTSKDPADTRRLVSKFQNGGPESLSKGDQRSLLSDPEGMAALHAIAWTPVPHVAPQHGRPAARNNRIAAWNNPNKGSVYIGNR